jgi:hypothetical protein
MTLEDWLACRDITELQFELLTFSERKLHLLTAAFLRRVWSKLPSHHSRAAVEATEKYAEGRITADALLWARSQAAREFGEWLWAGQGRNDDHLLSEWCGCCFGCARAAYQYECRVAKQGGILDGVRSGLNDPAWVAASAAFYALQLETLGLRWNPEDPAWQWEWQSMFATAREVLGEGAAPHTAWPQWRTTDVRALARGINAEKAFDRLPILADALQDAGCDDEDVLYHCRRPGGHVRGCWVVDLAMGIC